MILNKEKTAARGSVDAVFSDADPVKREITVTITSGRVDRDGEIVLPKGLNRKEFESDPLVLWSHDRKIPAIGVSMWTKHKKAKDASGKLNPFLDIITSRVKFNDKTELSRNLADLYLEGWMQGWSIGADLTSDDWGPPTADELKMIPRIDRSQVRTIYRDTVLREFSAVNIRSNRESLTGAAKAGKVTICKDLQKYFDEDDASVPEVLPAPTRVEEAIERVGIVKRVGPAVQRAGHVERIDTSELIRLAADEAALAVAEKTGRIIRERRPLRY